MNPLEVYLRELLDIRRSGQAVEETSYYGSFANLLNTIGKTLKPRVHCIINLKNRGAGIPDGGLFTADQLQKGPEEERLISFLPSRGAIEIKGTAEEVRQIATSEQVQRYLKKYGQVLVTNYRDFLLVGRNADGQPIYLESYQLAASEVEFWRTATTPYKMAEVHGEQFIEYLKRVMLYAAPLSKPEDVAWFLASYARDAKSRIEKVELPALASIRTALEEALGIKFEGKKGEHFFRSTLIQTLFYGIFSAWVLWSNQRMLVGSPARFSWREASWSLHVPMIRALFEQVATPTKLGPLGLVEVLDWTGAALNRVDQASFFSSFEEEHAVQYFYEPFLEAFDPELRKELGVWYTPQEIVQYMVARIDMVLREELDIEDGLADPRVYVLDPCCGTGTYLIEVLKHIATTLHEKGEDALRSYDIKKAATERVFGFEILPAPFVVAHLQLGLLLQHIGTPLSDTKNERVGVYLTNALAGWEPRDPAREKIIQYRLEGMPELKEERDAAEHIKQDTPILVILGNPPYNAFAGVSPKEEQELVEPYKAGLISEWGIKKFNLDDLYVRFFRLAERRIAEQTGKGIVCYISNYSYLGDPSFVVMRQRFLNEFDKLWFDSLNGDSRETGKLTPEGKPDPSVFSTEYNREGIRLGTTIGLMVCKTQHDEIPAVRFRQFWGVSKRADLLNSLTVKDFDDQYKLANPLRNNRFSFKPLKVASHYLEWPKLTELSLEASNGLMEKRSGALIDIDRLLLERRMQMYYDPQVSWETLQALGTGLTENAARFDAKRARTKVINAEKYNESHIHRYVIRPFDSCWCYYSIVRPLWNEPRPKLWKQCWNGNSFLLSRMKASKDLEGPPFYFVRGLSDDHLLAPDATCFPLHLIQNAQSMAMTTAEQATLLDGIVETEAKPVANYSLKACNYLTTLGITNFATEASTAELVWMHALAIGYSPTYLSENADGIQQDWPRIPLPNQKDLLLSSAYLGRTISQLLDIESAISGITRGKIRSELRQMAVISSANNRQLNLVTGDLAVTAGWGHNGKEGVTMPGKGKTVKRDYTAQELETFREGAGALGLTFEQIYQYLGDATFDIYLNNIAYWKNIPSNVWNYHIGGYQVIKKWLSYREQALLRRALTVEEVREVTNMTRRIAAILLLEPALDKNYLIIKQSTYSWPSSSHD